MTASQGAKETYERWRSYVETLRRANGSRPEFHEHLAAFREAHAGRSPGDPPPAAWRPEEATRERTHLVSLMREVGVPDFDALHRFSVEHREAFWKSAIRRLGIVFDAPPARILDENDVKSPRWLEGARYDITRSCFQAGSEKDAILFGREETGEIERTSYGELEREVNRFASGLRARGFEVDDAVALYMPMTPECIVAYLGTVRAGCRVISIADSFSVEELEKRLGIGGARAVVTLGGYRRARKRIDLYGKVRQALDRLGGETFAVVSSSTSPLDSRDVAWSDFLASDPGAAHSGHSAGPYHVTNVLFSSGTTGTPKAIPWTQLTPIKAAMDAHFHQDVHPEDVVCWPTNVGWMMGPWLVYASFVNRAAMALYEGVPTGRGFGRFVVEAGVSVLGVVPSIVRGWRAQGGVAPGDWPSVRVFSSTGEASSFEDYLWLMSLTDYRAPVIEYLGGTEIGGGHLTGTLLQSASPATFTTPALGIDVVALDEAGRLVPEGQSGEMFLVPPALGLSESLVNKSPAEHDEIYYAGCPRGPNGETLRRHGDRIARLPGGYFKAEGRADDTMNLGGIKVSSLEIERVVDAHEAVLESAAIGVALGGEGAESLVVFAVLAAGGEIEIERLRKELKRAIATELNPLFKLYDVVVVEDLPRTASNKVMRRSLRSAYAQKPEGGS